jgi:hypothetical protein
MNPPTIFQQYIKELVRTKEYFNMRLTNQRRIVGINDHMFKLDDAIVDWRENIHCFSEDYEKESKKTNQNHLTSFDHELFFHNIKDTLPDLMWVIIGYF